jgi:hypothetical protein
MVEKLKEHMSLLVYNGQIALWENGNISPGAERAQEIEHHLEQAQIILLCISASFLASPYCYRVEMQGAIKRHECKEARVISIILRPVHWNAPPLDKLQVLPDEMKPISEWRSQDKGWKNVVDGIMKVIEQWQTRSFSEPGAERKVFMALLDQLIATVKAQMQPPPRALATASTLQQLSIFIPNEVTLADLVVGWQTLARAPQQQEAPAVSQRRVTCGELAHLAAQFTTDQGDLAQAIETWRIWRNAFQKSDDPRQVAMATTFARELMELQKALP